jgi:hypothetical protein
LTEGDSITVSGSITPKVSSIRVTLTYTKPDTTTLTRYVNADSNGSYTDTYNPDVIGSWSVTASWSGDETYESSTSNKTAFTVAKKTEQGGIPGYPLEAVLIGVIFYSIILTLTPKKS